MSGGPAGDLDGRAGVVGDGYVAAGQPMEERRLPDVRLPDQGDGLPRRWRQGRGGVTGHDLYPVPVRLAGARNTRAAACRPRATSSAPTPTSKKSQNGS